MVLVQKNVKINENEWEVKQYLVNLRYTEAYRELEAKFRFCDGDEEECQTDLIANSVTFGNDTIEYKIIDLGDVVRSKLL